MVCQVCGVRNSEGTEFCTGCGAYLRWNARRGQQPAESRPQPPRRDQEYGVAMRLAERPPTEIAPGQELRVGATVRNTGTLVDEFVPLVAAPVGWIRTEPPRLSVYPGGEEPLTIVFAPPAGPSTPAGSVPYRVEVRSSNRPQVTSTVGGAITVAPIDALSAEIGPPTVYGRGRATAQIIVRNEGNRPVPIAVAQPIRGSGVRADAYPNALEVLPYRPAQITVRLRPDRLRWFGQQVHHPYRLRVTPRTGSRPIDLDAAMLQRPLLPWVPRAAALVVPLLALAVVAVLGVAALMIARNSGDAADPAPTPTATATGDGDVVVMPNLRGETLSDARGRLDKLGLDAVVSEQQSRVAEGTVLASDPGAGTRLRSGGTIRLIVSAGAGNDGNGGGGNDGGGGGQQTGAGGGNDGGGNNGGGGNDGGGGQQTGGAGDGGG